MSCIRYINLRSALSVLVVLFSTCCVLSASSASSIQEGIASGRLRSERWDSMHHVVRRLMTARVDPDTGKDRAIEETIKGTPLAKAEGIYTVLGRTRPSKRNNKLRFSLKSLISSRNEEYPGKEIPGYLAPSIFRAELCVFKTPAMLPVKQRQGSHANITVKSNTHSGLVGQTIVSLKHTNWEIIDVTDFVQRMIKSPNPAINFAFNAHAASGKRRGLAVSSLLQLSGEKNNTQRPVLVIYLKEPIDPLAYILVKVQEAKDLMDRKKRSTMEESAVELRQKRQVDTPTDSRQPNVTENAEVIEHFDLNQDACSLRNFYIDFSSIGWDHIIAPVGFDPRTCSGNCYDPFVSSTNHAIVRSWAYRNEHPELIGSPIPIVCCTPTVFSSMTLVIQEEDRDVLKYDTYYDMVAEECGCR